MSKDDQEHSIERQEGQVVPYAALKGYEIVRVYKDEGISGWKEGAQRPDFSRMLDDAQRGLFDLILCDDVDRFGRFDIHQYGAVVHPLREAGLRLETVAQGAIDWDDTLSQLTDAIRMVYKREQSSDTSRRILTRFIQLAREGRWVNGPPPYGYAKDPATGKLVPGDKSQVRVVKWLFETYATKDVSLRWLAEELYKRAVPSPTGKPRWGGNVIGCILRNRNYLGDLHWNEESKGRFQEFDGKSVARRKARGATRRQAAELIVVRGSHEPLIDRDTFERVQAKLAGNAERKMPPLAGGDLLLSGLMTCGHCGSLMVGRRGYGSRTDKGRPTYVCNGYNRWGRAYCRNHTIDERRLLPALVRRIQEDFLNPDNLTKLREEIRRHDDRARRENPDAARELRARVEELDGFIAKGNRNMALAEPDAIAGIAEAVRAWRAERDRASQELDRLVNRPGISSAEADVAAAEEELWRLRDGLAKEDATEVRAVLRELVSKVELWWDYRPIDGATRVRFCRGLIYVREDESLTRDFHRASPHRGGAIAGRPRASLAASTSASARPRVNRP
jgi:DNA invertase Pin-like site-specific DNA recombinase